MRERPSDRLVVLAYDHLKTFEFGIAVELFGLPREEIDDFYEFIVAGVQPGPLRATGGFTMTPSAGLEVVAAAGTVVVPGWPETDLPLEGSVKEALLACHAAGGRLVGICSGTFALADCGLLDRRRATTHWLFADDLRRSHPAVQVDDDALYIDEGDVLTSAGSAAGIDAGLHLIREDWGDAVAATVARRMVVPPHRDGGQSQYARPQVGPAVDRWLATLQEWAVSNLDEDLSVAGLARRAGVSTRTLDRRFRAEAGVSPGRWVDAQRLDAARTLLVNTDLPVEQVARRAGFGSATSLRHHFSRRLSVTPTAYRRRFGVGRTSDRADRAG